MKLQSVVRAALLSMLAIALLCAGSASAAEVPPLRLGEETDAVISDLEALTPQLIDKGRVPGLQIALIREGEIVWSKGYGVMNLESPAPVTSETIFEAASLTKPFFAYAVMMLVDEGLLDLDTPIIEYLPAEEIEKLLGHPLDAEGFRLDWFETITARHVLSHSGGMPHGEGGPTFPLFFEPGTEYKYSASGYFYLQKAVEHLKGTTLDTIMKKYVIDPLGMKNSSMVWRDAYEETMANGHDAYGAPQDFRKRTEANAAASLYTTAYDYALFVAAVMRGEGLKDKTFKEMLTPMIDVDKDMGLTWSLGFSLQKDANGTAFWQWGDYGIFRNYIIAYPEQKTAVVYLANSFYGLGVCRDLVAKSIGGQALGVEFLQYLNYDSPVCEFTWAVMDQGPGAVNELLARMTADKPDMLSDRNIAMIGTIFSEGDLYDEAIAFYTFILPSRLQSAALKSALARAHLEKGEYEQARMYYQESLEAENKEHFDSTGVDWALSFIKAIEEPTELPVEYLETLAGDYGPRHVKLENGRLYYFRDNAAATDYRELIPMSRDTFIMKELIYFRMRFELDENGTPIKIIGLYEWGYEDQSPRTK
jgi:CubicO group peptidase (beta-lactamase class C family)